MNIATDGKGSRLLTAAAYTALFLAGAVEGLIGSFQYSRLVPVAAIGFCVLLLATCLLGAWAMRSVSGALWPAVGWIVASFVLSMPVSGGSVIITNSTAGKWYLYGGTVSALGGIALSFGPFGPWVRGTRRGAAAMTLDDAAFRRAAGQFASGIVVVTTRGGHAMTVSAFTSVSLDPPLVLFCAEKIARFHDAVLAEDSWAVSILAEDDEKTARWLATRGRPLDGQLDGVAHHPGPATGAPLLDDALAVLECRTTAVHDAGDHSIVVGQVEAVTAPPETADRGPLLHYSGAYRRLRSLAVGATSSIRSRPQSRSASLITSGGASRIV